MRGHIGSLARVTATALRAMRGMFAARTARLQTFGDEEAGQALIELALFGTLFTLLLAGIANYATFIQEKMLVQEAAAAGAAYATIPGNTPANYSNNAGISAAAVASVSNSALANKIQTWLNSNPPSVVYSCSPGGSLVSQAATCADGGPPLMFVQVTVSVTVNSVLGYVGMPATITLTGFASYEVPWV